MDYEKKYKEALATAKDCLKDGTITSTAIDYISTIFPELKESEDERIRKALVRFHKSTIDIDGIKGADILAWLEKQGSQQPTIIWHSVSEEPEEMKELFCEWESDDATWHDVAFYDEESKTFRHAKMPINVTKWVYVDELLEKQGEQKPAVVDFNAKDWYVSKVDGKIHDMTYNPTNKAEQKFKVGDWIVQENIGVYKIIEVCESWYEVVDNKDKHYLIGFDKEYMCHLWTIQDAKDGDVLISQSGNPLIYNGNYNSLNIGAYCGITCDDNKFKVAEEKCHWTENVDIEPSTKEERDLLFAKMKEAGYEWDAEKKGLKKIEQRISDNIPQAFEKYVEHLLSLSDGEGHGSPAKVKEVSAELFKLAKLKQKHAWSEEDEKMYKIALSCIETLEDITNGKNMHADVKDWLKSIKDRIGG